MFLLKRFSTVMATPAAAAIQRHFSLLHRSEAKRRREGELMAAKLIAD